MNATITIRVQYDSAKERVRDFAVKYRQLRAHIERLQLKGVLPRGLIRWGIERIIPPTDRGPKGPAQVMQFRRIPINAPSDPMLLPVHVVGHRMGPEGIAV